MLEFIKNRTLPLAMITGALGYFAFAKISFLHPIKPFMNELVETITPLLIFMQLLLTFCRINIKEMTPSKWHLKLLLIQAFSTLAIASCILFLHAEGTLKIILEGAIICLLCPTATAAAVITGKLEGNVSSITTYTLLSNILTAVTVPLLFPLIESQANSSFITAFLLILSKVFPLLLLPFVLALFLKKFLPSIHQFLTKIHGAAFYLWAIALIIVTAQTVKSLVTGNNSITVEIILSAVGLTACISQFFVGKYIGSKHDDRISAGQALGQKNTVLAIWIAYTYLNPLTSIAPGSYVIWQNVFNSWQLSQKQKRKADRA